MTVDGLPALDMVGALLAAAVLTLPIAWHRERGPRSLGLRTLPLVAIASCGYALVGVEVAGDDPNALARVIEGLMTGIGFIGGGAILKQSDSVHGTATAAGIWATGAVGGAVAFDRLPMAVAISLLTFLVFLVLTPLGRFLDGGEEDSGP